MILGTLAAASAAGEPVPVRAPLDLAVNQVPVGVVTVLLRSGDALVEVAVLERAGLKGFAGLREEVNGTPYVSLRSLAPAITFEVDEMELTLRLTADPVLLGHTVLPLREREPPGIVHRGDPGAFLNYSLSWSDPGSVEVFGEAGLRVGRSLFLTTLSQRSRETPLRGLTQLLIDDRPRLRRGLIGDQLASSESPVGGGLLLGGLGLARDFSLDPYLVRSPAPDLSGTLLTPSTVEVYVNGLLIRREELPPGTFELRDLPVSSGSGTTRLVIRDAFGQERDVSAPYYFSSRLLAPGWSEYGVHLGFRRENLGTASFDYSDLAFLGRYRRGVTDRFTLGGHLEAAPGLASGGSTLHWQVGRGEIELAAAISGAEGETGAAGSLVYSSSRRRMGWSGSLRAFSPRYAHLGLPSSADRVRFEGGGVGSLPLGSRLSLAVQAGRQEMRDGSTRDHATLSGTLRLTRRASLFLMASRFTDSARSGGPDDRLLATFHLGLGEATSAQAVAELRPGEVTERLEVQRSMPAGPGFGFRLRGESAAGGEGGEGELLYQTRFGRYELARREVAGSATTSLRVSGAWAALGGGVHPARVVQDAFALVRVPGVAGVRVYRSNQEVGRTDSRGDFLVPDLLSNYGNRLGIADQDIPLDFRVEKSEETIAPPLRGGAVVRFPVWRLRAFKGTLALAAAGVERAPTPGRLLVTVGETLFESPIGNDGAFYLENLPPGRHPAVVESDVGRCEFSLLVPETEAVLMDLGRLVCG